MLDDFLVNLTKVDETRNTIIDRLYDNATALKESFEKYIKEFLVYSIPLCGINDNGFYITRFHCPVDVQVLDSDNKVIASFLNHVGETVDGSFAAVTDGAQDMILLPKGIDDSIWIQGNGTGDMDVDFLYIDANLDITKDFTRFSIPVHKGARFSLTVNDDNVPVLKDDKGQLLMYRYPSEVKRMDGPSISLPKGLTEIKEEAFYGNISMAGSVRCPEGLQAIGRAAFTGTNIIQIYLPESITFIDDSIFGKGQTPEIFVEANSYAFRWAVNHGYTVYIMDK